MKSSPILTNMDTTEGEPLSLFTQASHLLKNIKPTDWLIEGVVETEALSVLFGESYSGSHGDSAGNLYVPLCTLGVFMNYFFG